MTLSSRPENWQELLAGYALGDLSPEEAEVLRQLLDTHPDLRQEMAQLQEVLALMPYGLPEQEPPPHLREAILQQARSEPKTNRVSRRSRQPRFWVGLGGAVAALVVGALTIDNYRLRQENATAKALVATLKQPNLQLFSLQGTGDATQASGSLVVNPGQQVVIVVVQNLPQLPADQVYRLWAIEPGKSQPIFFGEFNSNPTNQTNAAWQIPAVTLNAPPEKMLITAEKAADPPVPAGELVMNSL